MAGFDCITYEVERGRARITLNRPKKLNAISLRMAQLVARVEYAPFAH